MKWWVAAGLAVLLAACSSLASTGEHDAELDGEWGLVSLDLLVDLPTILEFESAGAPARRIQIDQGHVFGSVGCGFSASFEYDPPKLGMGESFTPAAGEIGSSPCDRAAWADLLTDTHVVSFPAEDQMTWSSDKARLTFVLVSE